MEASGADVIALTSDGMKNTIYRVDIKRSLVGSAYTHKKKKPWLSTTLELSKQTGKHFGLCDPSWSGSSRRGRV